MAQYFICGMNVSSLWGDCYNNRNEIWLVYDIDGNMKYRERLYWDNVLEIGTKW